MFSYGETTYIQSTSYFLGSLKPGQSLQVLLHCQVLYVVLLFRVSNVICLELPFTSTLFLTLTFFLYVLTTSECFLYLVLGCNIFIFSFYIREIKDLFVVGQECPKVEVPAPNSKTVNQFQKDFLQVSSHPVVLR